MATLLERLRDRLPDMTDLLRQLVVAESPSGDLHALARCADVLAEAGSALIGVAAERTIVAGRSHLRWSVPPRRPDGPRVVLLGHYDTVWPQGTLARLPFDVDAAVARGPGVFDMKAGLVQLFHAVAALDDPAGIDVLVTGDEETGSATSRTLIEDVVRGARAALVLEASADGALKTARKGVGIYRIEVTGVAAHAGLEPEKGANALVELARFVTALGSLAEGTHGTHGTTVTPTTASAGTTTNTVPNHASVDVDVRSFSPGDLARVDGALRSLRPVDGRASVTVRGGVNRPPLPPASSAALFAMAQEVAADVGLPRLRSTAVGGGSDGNFAAACGVPTLDGLGAVGGGAHAEDEHVVVPAMAERAALLAGLLARLTAA